MVKVFFNYYRDGVYFSKKKTSLIMGKTENTFLRPVTSNDEATARGHRGSDCSVIVTIFFIVIVNAP